MVNKSGAGRDRERGEAAARAERPGFSRENSAFPSNHSQDKPGSTRGPFSTEKIPFFPDFPPF